jgi:hypothetical protein
MSRRPQRGSIVQVKRKDGNHSWVLRYNDSHGRPAKLTIGHIKEFPTKESIAELAKSFMATINADICLGYSASRGELDDRIAAKRRITKQQIERMSRRQQGRCAICGKETKLCVDHCHTADRVRELLCPNCNTGLGMFRDNPYILRAAALYLEKHGK